MKVCILNYTFSIGGFTSSLLPLVKYLKEAGVEVDLMVFDPKAKSFVNNTRVIVNNTLKRPLSKFKKALFLIDTPKFLSRYIKHILVIPIKIATYFCLNKLIPNKKKGIIVSIYSIINESEKVFSMTYTQSFLSMYVSEYIDKCDLSQYDCVISWEELFTNYFLAEKVIARRKIGYIHPDYHKAYFEKKIDERYYQKLDKIVLVSKATKKTFDSFFPKLAYKSVVLYNILDVYEIITKSQEKISTFNKGTFDIVTVCRLDNTSKALDRGINICSKLKQNGFDFKWYIVGDGPSKIMLQSLIKKNNLINEVILCGKQNNPYPFIKKADLFMLQSYYEGKPISVEEAIVLETPVLVSQYASAHEQVSDGITGFIAENDENKIYDKLRWIIENKTILLKIKNNMEKIDKSKYQDVTDYLNFLNDKTIFIKN